MFMTFPFAVRANGLGHLAVSAIGLIALVPLGIPLVVLVVMTTVLAEGRVGDG
jgi:hypothetical protein